MEKVNASVITIGDELLIGQIVDTNSAYISQELNKAGVWVKRRIAVGDDATAIRQALDEETNQSDLIILTGGLGPTADDITKPVLCEYFGGKLILNDQVLSHVTYLFEHVYKRPLPLLESNRRQAEIPDVCTVLMNEKGTAPGMLFEKNGKYYFSLPGVPWEMKALMQKEVIPRIQTLFKTPYIVHQTLLTAGVGESMLAEKIKDFESGLPKYMKLAYLPHFGMVRLRITASGENKNQLDEDIEKEFKTLKQLVKEWMVIDEDLSLQQALAKLLKERKQTVGTAESCTGGYIAHLLSRDAGASSNYKGSIISYDNKVKEDVLGVKAETLEKAGAVSRETVMQMAEGGLRQLKSDYIIVTSGIMGPDGGSEHKPIGLVWIAVGNKEKIIANEFHFRFDRSRNIEQTAITALNMLRKFINTFENLKT
jgi:nicotinamide-nucleotide amidase